MSDTAFTTKLAWFAPDLDTIEVECEVCGRTFETFRNQSGRAKYCPDCRDEATRVLAKTCRDNKNLTTTGDPTTNLVYGIYKQAVINARKGDRDAWQWIETDLELWLRACGLSLKPSERKRIRRMV